MLTIKHVGNAFQLIDADSPSQRIVGIVYDDGTPFRSHVAREMASAADMVALLRAVERENADSPDRSRFYDSIANMLARIDNVSPLEQAMNRMADAKPVGYCPGGVEPSREHVLTAVMDADLRLVLTELRKRLAVESLNTLKGGDNG